MNRDSKMFLALSATLSMLLFLVPEERMLGNLIKLVYLHAALMWIGLVILTLGVTIGLLDKQKCKGFIFVGAWFWIVATALGALTSKLAWGGMLLEPRVAGSIFIALAFLGILRLLNNLSFKMVFSLVTLTTASAWVIVFKSGFFHPENPIGRAESPEMKYIFLAISIILILIAAFFVKNANKSRN